MTTGAGGPRRTTLWDETADLTSRFWAELAALVVLGEGGGDTSDRYSVEVSENGMLVRDPSFRSRRPPHDDTRFLAWADIAEIRPEPPGTGRFVTVVLRDGSRVPLGARHADDATRPARLDALDRWFQRYRSPVTADGNPCGPTSSGA